MVVIIMYENYVIVTKKKSIELEPPSMDVIVLHIIVPKKNLLSRNRKIPSYWDMLFLVLMSSSGNKHYLQTINIHKGCVI